MELVGEGALQKWRDMIGPENSVQAKIHNSTSIRAAFGSDSVRNAVHAPATFQQKAAEMNLFFSSAMKATALFSNCTCCVIKPHAVNAGQAGLIIDKILEEGFEISSMQMFHLDKPTAEEFLEIY